MSLFLEISRQLVFSAPINAATEKWGVYCIPRLWKEPSGKLVIRFNGEQDTASLENMQQAPNLFFESSDNGASWQKIPDGDSHYDIRMLLGIGSPYLKLKSGEVLAFRGKSNLSPITGIPFEKQFNMPNGEAIIHTYRYGAIPAEAKGLERIYYENEKAVPTVTESVLEFEEREVFVNAAATYYEGQGYVPVPEYLHPYIFKNPYITGMTELHDGTLVALTFGQNPAVCDHYCPTVYLMQSTDKGLSWQRRGIVAEDQTQLPFGYSGDGNEASLALAENGDLLCAMRMDMSIDPAVATPVCDTMLAISHDGGFTWEKPVPVADSSVTPHIVSLKNGLLMLIYGRPGVHFKLSEDYGKTWGPAHSVIGLTLEEERKNGKSDSMSKYFDTSSYSNTFVEPLSEDTVIVVYNDMKYPDANGRCHKAGFVQRITVKRDDGTY